MSVNIPEEIQKVYPDFKTGNQAAQPTITAWQQFKENPNQQQFNKFIDAFKLYAQNPNPQQAQLPNQTQQPQAQQERMRYDFTTALNEKLNSVYKKNYYTNVITDYFNTH